MAPKVEKVLEGFELTEGPHWDAESQSLFFIDHIKGTIHKYTPSSNTHTKAYVGNSLAVIIPIEGAKDQFVVSTHRKLTKVTWDGISDKISNIEVLSELDGVSDTQFDQFNDGKADPTGRLWIGTLALDDGKFRPELGNFYSFEDGKKLKRHVSKVTVSNGLAWNRELKKFYYNDSTTRKVDQFDYDEVNGTISNRTSIFSLDKLNIPGIPDGQVIDVDGNLWVAVFGGGRVIKIDPRRPDTLLDTIYIPANQTTSVTFGGTNLDELYVTSGKLAVEGFEVGPEGGIVYKVTGTGSKGYPGQKVKL